MKKTLQITLGTLMLLAFSATTLNADIAKGQRLYMKKLKGACGFNGAIMATKHSMAEWKTLYETKKLAGEIKKFCPKVKESSLKGKFMPHYYDFFHEYANDSGNIPSC